MGGRFLTCHIYTHAYVHIHASRLCVSGGGGGGHGVSQRLSEPCVVSHIYLRRVSCMNDSCQTHKCVYTCEKGGAKLV